MKAMKIKNNIIQIFQVILFLVITVSYGQDDDPRGEGQYMDYNTVNVPEFAAFTEAGNIEVNTATGVPVISIPLYTLELDGVQVPISLSYDASGIKVTQMETSVGLGWSLNAGGEISRTIRGNADEHQNYNWFDDGFLTDEYYSNKDQNSTSWQKAMKGNIIIDGLAKLTDHNPDLFSYSFPGYSGTYIHQTNRNIIKEKEDGIILQPLSIGDSEITVNDLEGNSFIFDKSDAEYSFNKSYFATDYNLDEDFYEIERDGIEEYPNTWKLSLSRILCF